MFNLTLAKIKVRYYTPSNETNFTLKYFSLSFSKLLLLNLNKQSSEQGAGKFALMNILFQIQNLIRLGQHREEMGHGSLKMPTHKI